MDAPTGNYSNEFTFRERPVFGGAAWWIVHKPCGEELEYSGTYNDAADAARYGHDECPAYATRR